MKFLTIKLLEHVMFVSMAAHALLTSTMELTLVFVQVMLF